MRQNQVIIFPIRLVLENDVEKPPAVIFADWDEREGQRGHTLLST